MAVTLFCCIIQHSLVMCILVSICAVRFTVSQPPANNCSLDFEFSAKSNMSCIEGDWGGFLHRNCCGLAFQRYLYGLGLRANRTGLIYLNSTEQRSCLDAMKSFEGDVFGCGIEKLTKGGGSCSDFSVANVESSLGDKLKSLEESCRLDGSAGEWDQMCSSCAKSWQDITETQAISNVATNGEPSEIGSDVCRFAVLVSLTSVRINDEAYVQRLYECLADQSSSNVPDENQELAGKRKTRIRTGIWILIGGIISVILVTVSMYCILLRRQKSNIPLKNNAFKDLKLKESPCPKFSIREVYSATDNLNEKNLIGEGTAGKVYKGILPSSKQRVAVKHIINDVNVETVLREVMSLSHIRHPNLVALLGYCVRQDGCFLVYELCPNGNLSEWIFRKDKNLSWIQRLEIAIDSARGLRFLHTYAEGCIVHRDIKPTNILLGRNFEAKLSDFGLSKVMDVGESNVSSEVRGTFGYLDPEYQSNRQVNASGDVYSFGVVLLQILSGKKVVNMNLKKPMPLDKMAKSLTREGSIREFADPKMEGEYSAEAFNLIFQLAVSCTALKRQRPSMEQVVVKLEEAIDMSTSAIVSTPDS